MTHLTVARRPAPSFHPIQATVDTLGRVRKRLASIRRGRRGAGRAAQLMQLNDQANCGDIGISRAQAFYEHEKPFWRG